MKNLFTFLFLLTAWGITQAQTPTLSPANGATGVTASQEITVTFDQPIATPSGKTEIWEDNMIVLDPPAYAEHGLKARIEGNKLTIFHASFKGGQTYHVTIAANTLVGQTTDIKWSFTTKAPEPILFTPTDKATGVSNGDLISVAFDSRLLTGSSFYTGGISITPDPGGVNGNFEGDNYNEDNVLNINYTNLAANTTYTVNVDANVILGRTTPISWSFTTKPATHDYVFPANGMTANLNSETYVQFTMSVEAGDKFNNITISPDPGGVVPSIAQNSNRLVIAHNNYTKGTEYTVTVPAGAVKGIDTPISWKFTAQEVGLTSMIPEGGATGVAVDAEVKAVFNNPITAGTNIGNISFTPAAAVTGVSSTISGNTLSIAHDNFAKGTDYTVTIPANAISGISAPITWPFTTVAPAMIYPSIIKDATNVAVDAQLYVEYDGNIKEGSNFGEIKLSPDPGNVVVSVSGTRLTINHANFAGGTTYTIKIPANALKGQAEAASWSFSTVGPTASTYLPAKNAPNVAVDAPVSVGFNMNISAGNLAMVKFSPEVTGVVATVDVADPKKINIAHDPFTLGTEYTVIFPKETINGMADAISDWKFTTKSPTVVKRTPEAGADNVDLKAAVTVEFDNTIAAGAAIGNITITSGANSVTATASVNGKMLTITHGDFARNTEYTVTIPANAVKGAAAISWSFKTEALTYTTRTPDADVKYVGVKDEVSITFDADLPTSGNNLPGITINSSTGALAGVSGTIKDKKLTIAHNDFAYGTDYTVTVPANTISGYSSPITWSFSTIAPAVSSKVPENTTVAINAPVSATFAANIFQGVNFNNIDIEPSAGITPITLNISGSTLTIGHQNFTAGKEYTVTIPVDALKGLKTLVSWKFTTQAPAVTSRTPDVGASGVAVDAGISIVFASEIEKGTAFDNIKISTAAGATIATTSSLGGSSITIKHDAAFAKGTDYTVTIPAGAIKGLTDDIKWTFTTIAALRANTFTPGDKTTGVALNTDVTVEFNLKPQLVNDGRSITISPYDGYMSPYIEGNKLVIGRFNLDPGTEYTVTIPAGAITDYATPITWKFTTAKPVFEIPTDVVTNVGLDEKLTVDIKFDFDLSKGDKEVIFSPAVNGVYTTLNNKKLVIDHNDFDPAVTYTVTLPANTVKGQTDPYSWKFTTVKPVFESSTPDKGNTEVPVDQEVVVVFNYAYDLAKGDKLPTFSPNVDGVYTTPKGNKLTISHNNFAPNTTYTITLPANTVKGQTEEHKWSFTTVMVSGIKDMDKLDAKLYPNPVLAGTEFTILTDDNSNAQRIVEIFNATGAIVLKTETSNSLIKLAAPKEQGVYLLRITSGNKAGVYRLVVH